MKNVEDLKTENNKANDDEKKISLCETCYKQGNFPSPLKKEDFSMNHLA